MSQRKHIVALILGGVVLALVFFVAGVVSSQLLNVPGTNLLKTDQSGTALGDQTAQLFALMQREANDPPSETTATVGALNGLLRSNGDVYGRFLDAKALASYTEDMAGQFGGIGVVLGEKDGTVIVNQVYPNTPAAKAGLQAGDYFYKIDNTSSNTWTTQKVQAAVRGKVGTSVTLTMQRPYTKDKMPQNIRYTFGNPYTVTITRAIITTPNTESKMLDGHVGYVRLFEFNEKSTEDLRSAYEKLIKQGATSLVLDLRDNPGGDLNQAVGVGSLFLKKGQPVVQIKSRVQGTSVLPATGDTLSKELPLAVLVNANSASASEIVAGALQDYGRAKLVGSTTFGKACVQTELPFAGGAAFMTTADYLTAKGRNINAKGVTPDVKLEMDIALESDQAKDTQLQKALELVKAKAQ
ncbi:MAG: S41 family peptidase [Actinomycetia bacterium]|nr:S41 family peptidase [Actinomycetes bacterium]